MTRSTKNRIQLPIILALVLAALGLASGPSDAGTRVVVRVGPRRAVVQRTPRAPVPVVARRVWVPGHWKWNQAGHRYVWVAGRYVWVR
jgi:hypothetical protein